MAIIRMKEMRKMDQKELVKRADELRLELSKERGNIKIGSNVASPGRLREIRRTLARVATLDGERSREKLNKPAVKKVSNSKLQK